MPASRSLIALLIGTVAFFALWLVALKGGSSTPTSGKPGSQGLGQYQSAINQAHQAVQTSNASNAASGNDGTAGSASPSSASASSSTAKSTSTTTSTHPGSAASGTHSRAATNRLSTVQHAMAAHKVVAILFYNPAAADDQAVKQELNTIPTHGGQVVKLTVPLNEVANYTAVTQQVPVYFSPTLVMINPSGQAGEIMGYSDQFEIAQRVDDALASK